MAYDFSAYPTSANLSAWIAGVLPSANVSAVGSDALSLAVSAAAQSFERETSRQFVAAEATRKFDGSGTGILIVDDFVSISLDSNSLKKIYIYAAPGQSSGLVQFAYAEEVQESGRAKNMLQIFKGPVQSAYAWFASFPPGRSNIEITATWGYAGAVPADVFQLIMAKAAAGLLAGITVGISGGVVTNVKSADESETISDNPWWVHSGWSKEWDRLSCYYRRDLTSFITRREVPQY